MKAPTPCACTAVRKASRTLARAYDQALAPAGLNVTQLAVMRAVERRQGEPMARVAAELSLDRTSLYRSLASLRSQGWIEINDCPEPHSRSASITARGQQVLAEAGPLWQATQIAIIDRFGSAAWAQLVNDLERLQACIPAAEGVTS